MNLKWRTFAIWYWPFFRAFVPRLIYISSCFIRLICFIALIAPQKQRQTACRNNQQLSDKHIITHNILHVVSNLNTLRSLNRLVADCSNRGELPMMAWVMNHKCVKCPLTVRENTKLFTGTTTLWGTTRRPLPWKESAMAVENLRSGHATEILRC